MQNKFRPDPERPSVLIATPAYGGMLTYQYVCGLTKTFAHFFTVGQRHSAYWLSNESLIPRGRNRCAYRALTGGFDKLLFIDADIGFEPADVERLLTSKKRLVGGLYPAKAYPIELMMNSLPEHEETFSFRARTREQLQDLGAKYGNERGEVEVRHLPTGFMLIDCSVFKQLEKHVPQYPTILEGTKEEVLMHDFFPSGVNPETKQYESEDWAFCSLVRKHLQCGVWASTKTVLTHTGTHTFNPGHS